MATVSKWVVAVDGNQARKKKFDNMQLEAAMRRYLQRVKGNGEEDDDGEAEEQGDGAGADDAAEDKADTPACECSAVVTAGGTVVASCPLHTNPIQPLSRISCLDYPVRRWRTFWVLSR